MEWIDIKDKVPEDYAPILFVAKDSEMDKDFTRYGYKGYECYFAFEADGPIEFNKIKYWMPLPHPPRG